MEKILLLLTEKNKDEKLNTFAEKLAERIREGDYGKKVLVFSFFSDTIDYLKQELPPLLDSKLPNFSKQAAFVSGTCNEVENIAKRFSPISKNYRLKKARPNLTIYLQPMCFQKGKTCKMQVYW